MKPRPQKRKQQSTGSLGVFVVTLKRQRGGRVSCHSERQSFKRILRPREFQTPQKRVKTLSFIKKTLSFIKGVSDSTKGVSDYTKIRVKTLSLREFQTPPR
jgi:hypothetical protein